MSWCSGSAARAPRAVALLLTFDDVGDEPQVLIDPADLEPAVLVRVAPIRDLRPVLDHQVEEVAAHLDGDPRVGGDFALDLDLRHLQPELLDVAAALQVHPHNQLELLERGDLVEEAAHRLPGSMCWSAGPPWRKPPTACSMSFGASCGAMCAP